MQSVPYDEFEKYLGKTRPCLICNTDPDGSDREIWG